MEAAHRFSIGTIRIKSINFAIQKAKETPKAGMEIHPKVHVKSRRSEKIVEVDVGIDLQTDKLPFSFSVIASGLFQFENSLTAADLEKLVNVNCASIIFPFVRECIADLTRRGGFPPLILPPFNFAELHANKKKAKI